MDHNPDLLRHAPSIVRTRCVAGDLLALPFEHGCGGTVICNTSLNCLFGGRLDELDAVLRDINRLLRSDGRICCCVHTRAIANLHLGYRLLNTVGLRRWAARYIEEVHRSSDRTIHLSAEQWCGRLSAAGFAVERAVHFFDEQDSRLRRQLRVLRHLPPRSLALRIRDWLILRHQARTRRHPKLEPGQGQRDHGYVLIVARNVAAPASVPPGDQHGP